MSRVILVTGGGRSGKSRYALERAMTYEKRVFVATAEPSDDEMRERIARHKQERGDSFVTVEAPIDLAPALEREATKDIDVALVDCLTVWTGNLMHFRHITDTNTPQVEALIAFLNQPPCDIILVTNEVGMGIIPENAMSRKFRDIAGRLNQTIAELADEVVLVVSGIPVRIKK